MRKLYTVLTLSITFAFITACSQPTTQSGQLYYTTQVQAGDALIEALISKKPAALEKVLGAEFRQLIPLDKAVIGAEKIQLFVSAWEKSHSLVKEDANTFVIQAGDKHWTFPVPIIKEDKGWRFDAIAGLEQINNRRIGRNELSVMQASLAYRDAQQEYFQQDRNNNGVLEYAQQFISSAGKQDGLYWPATETSAQSPLGPLFAEVNPQGAYHGYYYKILTAQGAQASGGVSNYLLDNRMVKGFALIAWPAEYGVSGVMSFMLNAEGILFEADLGPEGDTAVASLSEFNPDENWQLTGEEFLQVSVK